MKPGVTIFPPEVTIRDRLCYDKFMSEIDRNITSLFEDGRWHKAGEIGEALGVTRQTAHRHLKHLVGDGVLIVEGAGRGTRYRLCSRGFSRRWNISGLDEAALWEELSVPDSLFGSLPEPSQSIIAYAVTELVNNVVDHSGSTTVSIASELKAGCLILEISDQGVGIFNHIRDRMGLNSEIEALQELSKGKTTTLPDRHTGEGIFFTSKAVHLFEIQSGSLRWIVDNRRHDTAVGEVDPSIEGTHVCVELDPDRARDLTNVFSEYAEDFEFAKTRTIIKLFTINTRFVSRSEAKRLLHGLEKFREVVLDFKGVELVGQGFADEIFRVWARMHPETHFVPVSMCEPVAFMVERAIRRAEDED